MLKRKTLFTTALLLVVVAGVLFALETTGATDFFHRKTKSDNTNPSQTINYKPATTEEKSDSDSHKTSTSDQTSGSDSNSGNTTTKKPVEVTITRSKQDTSSLYVNGYVSGVVEDGGTCTLTLKSGNSVVSRSRQAVSNATNTTCGETVVPLSALHTGTWQAVLSYSSKTSTGQSSVTDIVVE